MPELIFEHLLPGSHLNDNQKKIVGAFTVEIADRQYGNLMNDLLIRIMMARYSKGLVIN